MSINTKKHLKSSLSQNTISYHSLILKIQSVIDSKSKVTSATYTTEGKH